MGWRDIYAALTDERPHEAIHRPIPDIWLATTFGGITLQRNAGNRMNRDTLSANLVSITAPGETIQDFIGTSTTALHVYLKAEVLREVAEEMFPGHGADRSIIPVFAANDRTLVYFLRTIKEMLVEDPANNTLKMEYLSRALAAHLLQRHSSPGTRDEARAWQDGLGIGQQRLVLGYIEDNLELDISIGDLAALVGLGRVQFMRRFKCSMRMSAYQYVMHARIRRAKSLLKQRQLALADIALICGFASQSHFSSVFKRLVNMPPAQYRRIVS